MVLIWGHIMHQSDSKESSKNIGFWRFCLFVFTAILLCIVDGGSNAQTLSKEKYSKAVTKDIAYGREKGNVGMLSDKTSNREGPESFSHDAEGNLYICDTVNRSIQIFSSNGEYLRTISLGQEIEANDIALDKYGSLYVYNDRDGRLYQFDKNGDLLIMISVDPKRWQSRGPMHIIDDSIYLRSGSQEDILIGRIVENTLVLPTPGDLSKPLQKGIHGQSGKRYFTRIQRMKSGEVDVISKTGKNIRSIKFSLPGIVSVVFLREDKMGSIYIQTERLNKGKIVLEVRKYDSEGTRLTTVLIQDNDYGSWSVKLLSLDEHGTIYQFRPGTEKGQLNIFQKD